MRGLFVTAFGLILAVVVSAQNLSAPEFDVVSIKRNTTTDPRSFETKTTGSQITSTNVSLRALIYRAYDITADTPVLGLPPWAASERYDIIAKAAAPPTQPQSRQMWRALLADRMKFVAHMETREQQVFNLVVVRGDRTLGAGLTRSTLTCNQPSGPPADFLYQMRQTAAQVAAQPRPASPDPRKALITPEATARTLQSCSRISTGNSLVAGSMTMAALANFLTVPVERLVIDKTGLDGPFAIQMLAPSNEEGGSLFTALREQLGLSLEPARVQAPALIVDRIERPTAD